MLTAGTRCPRCSRARDAIRPADTGRWATSGAPAARKISRDSREQSLRWGREMAPPKRAEVLPPFTARAVPSFLCATLGGFAVEAHLGFIDGALRLACALLLDLVDGKGIQVGSNCMAQHHTSYNIMMLYCRYPGTRVQCS